MSKNENIKKLHKKYKLKMEAIKNFLYAIDIFGITYAFRYKKKERYQTVLGGFILILFLVLVLAFGIYNFIPFINRKNYAIVYYTMNLASTEEVNLFQSESNIAVGVECDSKKNERFSVYDILDLQSSYVLYEKNINGKYNKQPKTLKTHQCTSSDFYNKYDEQMDYLGIFNYQCLENKEDTIQGIYTDQIFSYFEFTVSAKNESVLDEIERFLFENDCKFQIIYTDIIIDLDNYEEPISQYLDSLFIQLNPTLFIKRNMYFMNQYFSNDDYLFFVFGDEKPELKTLYSSYEEYSLYMGMQRKSTRPYNFDKYAKIYLRAGLKKTIITRKYEKIMEFYADTSSILIALYEVLYLIFNFIDYFYAYHSLAQHIFFFKGIEGNKNYNIFEKTKQIQEIISLIESKENSYYPEENLKISRNKNKEENEEFDNNRELNSNKNGKTIIVYKNKKKQMEKKYLNNFTILKKPKINGDKISSKNLYEPKQKFDERYKYNLKENNLDSEDNLDGIKLSQYEKNLKNILSNNYNNKIMDSHYKDPNSNYRDNYPTSFSIKMNNNLKIKNTFNIFEIFISQIFKCCMSQNMKIKNYINENANEIIYSKLDIITFVKNMILFDIINRIILEDDKKDIFNFLCRPIISVKKNQTNELNEFYNIYKEEDFDKFINNIQDLSKKSEKINKDNQLISIAKEKLKEYI